MQGHKNPKRFSSLAEAVKDAYRNGEEDERLDPIVVVDEEGIPKGRFSDGDHVIFYDIRGEREIEITRSFVDEDFDEFPIKKGMKLHFTTMIEYDKNLNVNVAFPPNGEVKDTLCHVLSNKGLNFVKIVESEKAVHLGYFFNGKSKEPLPGEQREIIPTKKVTIPDESPNMRISEVVEVIKTNLGDKDIHVIIANLANVDVVGHTENKAAIIQAIEAVDNALGEIMDEAKNQGITSIVTADHGTVEKWLYPDGTIDTGHTSSPVPFIIVEPDDSLLRQIKLRKNGELTDVAPTILSILNLPMPGVMTGKTLLLENPYQGKPKKRILFVILDGWGAREERKGNLISEAKTPVMGDLFEDFPSIRLEASGESVGMPKGSVGNSEAGHLHLGAGRRISSDRFRIDKAIEDGSYFINEAFLKAIKDTKSTNKNLHLLGIVSFYSSHGSLEHLKALLRLINNIGVPNVFIHSILGRRGEKPESGSSYIHEIEELTDKFNTGSVVTVIGRHWVLDREENWDRVEKAYNTLVYGQGEGIVIK